MNILSASVQKWRRNGNPTGPRHLGEMKTCLNHKSSILDHEWDCLKIRLDFKMNILKY